MAMRRGFVAAIFLVACAPASLDPPARREFAEPAPFTDINPDPDIVEVSLVVEAGKFDYLPGRPAEVWAYRDAALADAPSRVPGPLIEAKVGDLVIVHARNELAKDGTSVHFHGIRLDAEMDGAHHAMLPGEIWEQRFVAKDAGFFWYHPHIRADVQIERGLHGPLLVREGESPRPPGDRVLMLDDVKLDESGDLAGEWTREDIVHGRQGNMLLVNGIPGPTLRATAGSRERWRLVNASNGRILELSLEGRTLRVIGWDGGRLGEPYDVNTLLIAPGERYDVLVDIPANAGASLVLRTNSPPHHAGAPAAEAETLLTVDVVEGRAVDASPPAPAAPVEKLPIGTDTPERGFVLGEDLDSPYGPIFKINDEIWPFQKAIEGALGDLEIWRIESATGSSHPFHVHGMFFQVLDRNGISEAHLGWKDTALVPADGALRFAVRYEAPGAWMYHCQIPEHAERGMMGNLVISEP